MPTKAERFLAAVELTGDLSEVPGLGAEKGIPNLKSKGINTTYQLIGHFLRLDRKEDEMVEFLVREGNRRQDVEHTARALNERVANKGFRCDVRLSDHVVKTATSKFDDSKKTSFLERRLTGKLSDDFFGIKNEAGFLKAGIANTDQLFGAFLSIIDDPDPSKNTSKCEQFYKKLDALGAAAGFKSVIIYQLQAKLAVGIDTHGKAALGLGVLPMLREVSSEALTEEEYDVRERAAAPGTGSGSRTAPPRTSAAKPSASRKLDYEPAKGSGSSSWLLYAALVPVAAVVAYYLLAPDAALSSALPKPEDGMGLGGGEWL